MRKDVDGSWLENVDPPVVVDTYDFVECLLKFPFARWETIDVENAVHCDDDVETNTEKKKKSHI